MKRILYIFTLLFLFLQMCRCSKCFDGASNRNDTKNAFNFFVISDWGWNGSPDQRKVADQMAITARYINLRFIVTCGDNFQLNGVTSVHDSLWFINYKNVYWQKSLHVDWYPVLGNHDYIGNTQAEIDYSRICRRWKMENYYYTFARRINDSVSARFIFLDTPPLVDAYYLDTATYPDIEKLDSAKEIQWLKETLSRSTEQWKLVFGHHPIFSASPYHGNTKEMIEKVKPLLEKFGAQIYFCGHDHDLQHLKEKNGKVDYLVTGTGGNCRRDSTDEQSIYSNSVLAFSFVSFKADGISVAFINTSGQEIYRFTRKIK